MHSNAKAQHLPKSTALLYNLSYQLVLQPTARGHILQIFLWITIQNQISVRQRVIIDSQTVFAETFTQVHRRLHNHDRSRVVTHVVPDGVQDQSVRLAGLGAHHGNHLPDVNIPFPLIKDIVW